MVTGPCLHEQAMPPPERDVLIIPCTALADYRKGLPFPPAAEKTPLNTTKLVAKAVTGLQGTVLTEMNARDFLRCRQMEQEWVFGSLLGR